MSAIFRRLVDDRKVTKASLGKHAVDLEMRGAAYDLERAKVSLAESDFKWATIKGYYSIFHSGRALLYRAGYRERSHRALLAALKELYGKTGRVSESNLANFENAMNLREEAD